MIPADFIFTKNFIIVESHNYTKLATTKLKHLSLKVKFNFLQITRANLGAIFRNTSSNFSIHRHSGSTLLPIDVLKTYSFRSSYFVGKMCLRKEDISHFHRGEECLNNRYIWTTLNTLFFIQSKKLFLTSLLESRIDLAVYLSSMCFCSLCVCTAINCQCVVLSVCLCVCLSVCPSFVGLLFHLSFCVWCVHPAFRK